MNSMEYVLHLIQRLYYNFHACDMFEHLAQALVHLAYTGLFISPSGTSELDYATTKKDRAERSISIGRESLKVFFLY